MCGGLQSVPLLVDLTSIDGRSVSTRELKRKLAARVPPSGTRTAAGDRSIEPPAAEQS